MKPSFWENEALTQLPISARLLFLGLIQFSDDEGRQRGNLSLIRSKVFPCDEDLSREQIAGWIAELERAKMVVSYEVDGAKYLQVTNFCKHQRISHPAVSTLPPPPFHASSAHPPEERRPDKDKDKDKDKEEESVAPTSSRELNLLKWHAHLWGANDKTDSQWGKRQLESARWLLANVDERILAAVLRWAKTHRFWAGRGANINRVRQEWVALKAQFDAETKDSIEDLERLKNDNEEW